jgi:hypothetical protein
MIAVRIEPMWRLRILGACSLVTMMLMLGTGSVAAHNAGCVLTGNGEYVFVGSNKDAPAVPVQNPNSSYDATRGLNVLDLQPSTPGSDQYGARYAADQGNSAVVRPTVCSPDGPRAGN